MRTFTCAHCGASSPLQGSYRHRGAGLCKACAARAMEEGVPGAEIEPVMDHGTCHVCGADRARGDWPLVAGRPTCDRCRPKPAHAKVPRWLLAAGAACLLLAVASTLHSLRFVRGYVAYRLGVKAYRADRTEIAAGRLAQAAALVPEEPHFAGLAAYYRGLTHLAADRPREARASFREACAREEDVPPYKAALALADRDLAWLAKDYRAFLKASEAFRAAEGDTQEALGALASAQACLFAVEGDPGLRDRAQATLARAERAPATDPGFAGFAARIRHRLATREILDKAAFEARYPQGWPGPGGRP